MRKTLKRKDYISKKGLNLFDRLPEAKQEDLLSKVSNFVARRIIPPRDGDADNIRKLLKNLSPDQTLDTLGVRNVTPDLEVMTLRQFFDEIQLVKGGESLLVRRPDLVPALAEIMSRFRGYSRDLREMRGSMYKVANKELLRRRATKELIAFHNHFDGKILLEDVSPTTGTDWLIMAVMGPITLRQYQLGRFEVGITTNYRLAPGVSISARPLDPLPAALSDKYPDHWYYHPHVLKGLLCLGGVKDDVEGNLTRGNIYTAFLLVEKLMRSYYSPGAHRRLHTWDVGYPSAACSGCGQVYRVRYLYRCGRCDTPPQYCGNCRPNHLYICPCCEESSCSDHGHNCIVCGNGCCTVCDYREYQYPICQRCWNLPRDRRGIDAVYNGESIENVVGYFKDTLREMVKEYQDIIGN